MKRKMIVPTLALAVFLGAGALVTSDVYAEGNSDSKGPQQFAHAIAVKFGLNESDVTNFLQEQRQVQMEMRQQDMQAHQEQILSDAVTAGTITEEQKNLLEDKMAEHRMMHDDENWQDMTPEERRAEAQARRDEFEAWAQDNGIDLTSLDLGMHGPKENARVGARARGFGNSN